MRGVGLTEAAAVPQTSRQRVNFDVGFCSKRLLGGRTYKIGRYLLQAMTTDPSTQTPHTLDFGTLDP